MSRYSARAASRPGWREQQIVEALARERARREADPEAFRARRREAARRCRQRQQRQGLTFDELARKSGALPGSIEREWLAFVLRSEQRKGRIEYHSTSRRYVLNSGLDEETRAAFADLRL